MSEGETGVMVSGEEVILCPTCEYLWDVRLPRCPVCEIETVKAETASRVADRIDELSTRNVELEKICRRNAEKLDRLVLMAQDLIRQLEEDITKA
jgi:hypothetical protein